MTAKENRLQSSLWEQAVSRTFNPVFYRVDGGISTAITGYAKPKVLNRVWSRINTPLSMDLVADWLQEIV